MKIKIEYRVWLESGLDSNANAIKAVIQIGNKFGKSIPVDDLGEDILGDVYFYAESGKEYSRKMRVTYNGHKCVVWGSTGNLLGLWISESPIHIFMEGVTSQKPKLVHIMDIPETIVMYKSSEGFWSSTYRRNAEKREIRLKYK